MAGTEGDLSIDVIVDSLGDFVDGGYAVNEAEVIGSLESMRLGPGELDRVLRVCERGKQMCLSERMDPTSYDAIISYIRGRLSNIQSL